MEDPVYGDLGVHNAGKGGLLSIAEFEVIG